MRIASVLWAIEIPGLQVYLFRRIREDLHKNHMEGPKGYMQLLAGLVNAKRVKIVEDEIRFWNGSKIYLCHCKDEKDRFKYDGAEMHVLMIDELTHFTETIYRYLRSRVRMVGMSVSLPDKYKGHFPKILTGSNPGKIGHAWVKRTFIDFQPPMDITKTDKEEGGMLRQFIPAMLEDNPSMQADDPEYENKLEGLGTPDLVRAMRYGDWDITAGAAFEKLSRTVHMIRPFAVPAHWTKFTVIDWGSAKPFAVGWFCVCDDTLELKAKEHWPKRIIPKGALILYRELYGWNGKPNEGCRKESFEVARQIIEIEEEASERIDYRVGDSQMWSSEDGPSIEEKMHEATGGLYSMEQSIKDRENNYSEFRTRLVGEDGYPMFYATSNCQHFWRTMPDLQLDERQPEKGPESSQEDHIWDVCSYACASRPMVTTKRDRANVERKKRKSQKSKEFY